MHGKLLVGVTGIAISLGSIATFGQRASAHGQAVSCTGLSGTITFGTPISKNGTPTTARRALQTRITGGSFSCGSLTSSYSPITINRENNTANPTYSPTYCQVHPSILSACDKYVTGTQGEWDTAPSLFKKTVKRISFLVAGKFVSFKITGGFSAFDPDQWCPAAEVAVVIDGQARSRFYPDKVGDIVLCLSGDTGPNTTGRFAADIRSTNLLLQIDTATIDSISSAAQL